MVESVEHRKESPNLREGPGCFCFLLTGNKNDRAGSYLTINVVGSLQTWEGVKMVVAQLHIHLRFSSPIDFCDVGHQL